MVSRPSGLGLLLIVLCFLGGGCRFIAGYDRAEGDLDASEGRVDLRAPTELGGELLLDLPPRGVCGGPGDAYVARWTFDDLTHPWSDGQIAVAAVVQGSLSPTPGQSGCGGAVLFTGDVTSYLKIPHIPRWSALSRGAIELWARFDAEFPGVAGTLLSRDAINQGEGGHLAITYRAGVLAARLQAPKVGSIEEEAFACVFPTTVLEDGKWHHVVVSFGGGRDLEIYLDGQRGAYVGSAMGWSCGTKPSALREQGIAGNGEPFVVGAGTTGCSPGGLLDRVDQPFEGAIDELRIHDTRIDYDGR